MANVKQGQGAIQTQRMEQRQVASVQQVLAAKLTELSVEELRARIESECEDNPWLESSSGAATDYSANAGSDMDDGEMEYDEEKADDTYAPEPSQDDMRDDDFPQPQNQEGTGTNWMQNEESEQTFHDVLMLQVGEYDLTEKQQRILEYLIGSLDKDGMLRLPLEQIADELDIYEGVECSVQEVEETLAVLQQFDPWGVGARNLIECLLIQVKRNKSLPMRNQLKVLLSEYGNELSMGRWDVIQKRMQLTKAEVAVMRNSIKRLNPRPGGSVGRIPASENSRIIPDFTITVGEEGNLSFHLNEDVLPVVTLADDYTDESALMLAGISDEKIRKEVQEAQRFQRSRMDEGRIFIEALAARRHSMLVTMAAILRLQKPFFLEGDENMLRPMKLEDVAQLAKIDISTVSRVCRSKSVDTPYGVFALNWFFSSGTDKDGEQLSVRHVQNALIELVKGEDKAHPYSDDKLAQLLREQGYAVARRTIAKYRDILGIPDSRLRR